MDRMRAGLTGLGVVFLFTLAASLAFGPSDDAPVVEAPAKEPGEPLAQLGVAPSSENSEKAAEAEAQAEAEAATPAPPPAPAAPAAPPASESPVTGVPDPMLAPGGDRPVAI